MKKKKNIIRIIAILLSVFISINSIYGYVERKKVEAGSCDTNKEYIISAKRNYIYNSYKKEWDNESKLIVRHNISDEKYLESENMTVASLSESEIKLLKRDSEVDVERDIKVSANTTESVYDDTPKNYNLGDKIAVNIQENDKTEEYTNNPHNFVPLKETKVKGENELVPWNIKMVAGNPDNNKYTGKRVKIAVIDSGIDTHNELLVRDWIDFSDRVDGYKPTDNSGHGTSIAGVIGARINGVGLVGIASDAELYSVKVLNSNNEASISTIIKALEWCIDNKMDVINMSFGMNSYSKILEKEIKKVYNNNIILVASSGNEKDKVQYPAAYDDVISVGSVNKNLQASTFSDNRDSDFVAPGEDVYTTNYVGSYLTMSGTSISAAHITGIIACIKSADKNLTNEKVKTILKNSSMKLEDGSRFATYDSAISTLKGNKKNIDLQQTKKNRRDMELDVQSDKTVSGLWLNDKWTAEEAVSGHYTIINNMDLSYFSKGASNDTEKIHNRWIVGDSIYRMDTLAQLKANGLGNCARNNNGEVDYSKENNSKYSMYSPYHSKTEYSLAENVEHLEFLYELSRRRLILHNGFDMTATNYNGDSYYSAHIPQKMKRRIIVDLNVLYNDLAAHYSGSGIAYTTTYAKGYMILGAFLHLVQDMQAHRAKVTKNMLYNKNDGTEYFTTDIFTDYASDSQINGNNIKKEKYWDLYNDINSRGAIPIIKLKNFLIDEVDIVCNGKKYHKKAGHAYEDNPFFYRRRFESAKNISSAYIDRMNNDIEERSSQLDYYFIDSSVPLYSEKYVVK